MSERGAMSRAVVVMSLLTETWRCGRVLAEAEILREDVEARMSTAVMVPCSFALDGGRDLAVVGDGDLCVDEDVQLVAESDGGVGRLR